MKPLLLLLLLQILNILIVACCSSTPYPYLLQTNRLPNDLNFMPSLSNGHVGFTVFGDAMFMNGIYNGARGDSRRARIPNWINMTAVVCNATKSETTYEMNLNKGYFRSIKEYPEVGVTLEQRTYAHRYYNRALVYQIVATRQANFTPSPLFLQLNQEPGKESDAIDFVVVRNDSNYRVLRGRTKIREFEELQPELHEFYVILSNWEKVLQFPSHQKEILYTYILTIDRQLSVAEREFVEMQKLNDKELLQSHSKSWQEFWNERFSIEISGDLELWRIANAGIFYLASSLPSPRTHQANDPYYGLSPTGLPRGNLDADYEGHNFWDTEIWMLPIATLIGFDYAEILLGYRHSHLAGARYNANATGYLGARFPWESAFTGAEVTNPCCPEIAQQEIHISPDIVFALEKYFAQSHNQVFLCKIAWPIASDVAKFLVSRSTCEELCHFRNVMGPDEDHANVDDSVFTNAVAKIALRFAVWAGRKCESIDPLDKWQEVGDRLVIVLDKERNYHPQHLGYQLNETVKQADTILLGYPLLFDTSHTHVNDLKYYSEVTRESGPAMTWSMFAANYLATEEDSWRADDYFERGYKSYVRPEFKVWSENAIGFGGSANFLTGIGGFLQALIFGYGGIAFQRVGNESQLMLRCARMPPQVERITMKFLRFSESNCTFQFSNHSSNLNCQGSNTQQFLLDNGYEKITLNGSFNVTRKKEDSPISITTA